MWSAHLVEPLEGRTLLSATLVKDLDLSSNSSFPLAMAVSGNYVYVATQEPGRSLYRSDGTDAGTVRLTGFTNAPSLLTPGTGSSLWFYGDKQNTGGSSGLWRTDGTVAGTTFLKAFGTGFGNNGGPYAMIDVGGMLYFSANDQSSGSELWKSNGTAAGTVPVKDIATGAGSSDPHGFASIGSTLYFAANDGSGEKLYKSDGTANGTVVVKDPNPGGGTSIQNIVNYNGTLLFVANDGAHGYEVWKSNGTSAGTTMVTDIAVGANGSLPGPFTISGGKAFFTANDGTVGEELWKTDGTAAGTSMVADLRTAGGSTPSQLTPGLNGKLYFFATDDTSKSRLYVTDGTLAGTVQLTNDTLSGLTEIEAAPGAAGVYFIASDQANGQEIWSTDGTTLTRVSNFQAPGGGAPQLQLLTGSSARLYFSGYGDVRGVELWRTDGTAAGTTSIDLNLSSAGSSAPTNTTSFKHNVFFTAHGSNAGLWRSDGTPEGTVSIRAGAAAAGGVDHVVVGNNLFWIENDSSSAPELWKTDGTNAGTSMVMRFALTPPTGVVVSGMVGSNGLLYFGVGDDAHGKELWSSDGTTAGTVMVKDIAPGTTGANPQFLTDVNGTLFFYADDGTNGFELWKSNGTAASTVLVKDIAPGSASSAFGNFGNPSLMVNLNGVLIFPANDGTTGVEMWRSDGTSAGTTRIVDLAPATGQTGVIVGERGSKALAVAGGFVYFFGYDGTHADALFRTNGLAAGTTLVSDIDPSEANAAFDLTAVGSDVYFIDPDTGANDAYRLYRSNGTPAGTVILHSFVSTGVGNFPRPGDVTSFNNNSIYLSAFDAGDGAGAELWRSDGTVNGTVRTDNINPTGDSNPSNFRGVDNILFFSADDGTHGAELWKVEPVLPAAPAAPTGLAATAVGGFRIDLTWTDHATNETSIRIERSTSPTFATIDKLDVLLPDTQQYTDTGLTRNTTYYYRVYARNDAGPSASISISKGTLNVPEAPVGLGATPGGGGASPAKIDLAWFDTANNETGFRLERSLVHTFATIDRTVNLGANIQAFSDTTVAPLTMYYYRLVAVNALGDSQPAFTSVKSLDVLPAAPGGFTATPVAETRVNLSWVDNAGNETGYRLERSRSSTFATLDPTVTLPAGTTSYADTTVVPAATYYYRLVAFNALGDSQPVVTTTATTPGTLPALPTNLVAAGTNESRVDLIWQDNANNETGYRIERSTAGGPFVDVGGVAANVTYYSDTTGLLPTTAYTYRVRVVAQSGPVDVSNSSSTATLPPNRTTLVEDLNLAPAPQSSDPSAAVVINGIGYFAATDPAHGRELWRTDGTTAGTFIVADLNIGGSANPQMLTGNGGALYFSADDGIHGQELWKSDGTAGGTALVKDVAVGSTSSAPGQLVAANSILYFTADDSLTGREIWRSDGTTAGTVRVADINPGTATSVPTSLTALGSALYFSATDGVTGLELWKTDGTTAGTVLIKEINPGAADAAPTSLVAFNSKVYFAATNATTGRELYVSDGTSTGTALLANIGILNASSNPANLTVAGPTLFFTAVQQGSGTELWTTDGVTTAMVADLAPGSNSSNPHAFNVVGSVLTFVTNDTGTVTLWRSGGTAATTSKIAELVSGIAGADVVSPVVAGASLYFFTPRDGGMELWKSDLTASGTQLVFDVIPTGGAQNLAALSAGRVIFAGSTDDDAGIELWTSAGTAATTSRIADILPATVTSNPGWLTNIGSSLYFTTDADWMLGAGLWKSDGTAAGTTLLRTGDASNLTNVNGTLFFRAAGGSGSGSELWKTDGTSAGTVQVKDVTPGAGSTTFASMTAVGGLLYFTARPTAAPAAPLKLWRSDGSTGGTIQLSDTPVSLGGGSSGLPPSSPTGAGGLLYFAATASDTGTELWRSDGTVPGTRIIRDFSPGNLSSNPTGLAAFNNRLYFFANDPTRKWALWSTDGSDVNTTLVKDIYESPTPIAPSGSTVAGSYLYFAAEDSAAGYELFRSDGSTAGTGLFRDVNPGVLGSGPSQLTNAGGRLYYSATAPATGLSLYTTDESVGGAPIRIRPLSAVSTVPVVAVGQSIFYVDGSLWRSDGAFAGTVEAAPNVDPSVQNATAYGPIVAPFGSGVAFRANDLTYGIELASASLATPAAPTAVTAEALSGSVMRVRWTDNASNESGYWLERIPQGATPATERRDVYLLAGTTEFVDVAVPVGSYLYRVRSYNLGGTSAAVIATVPNDTVAPTADVVDVTPDPRVAPVGSISIVFSEPVNNFDLSDLRLDRGGVPIALNGAALTTSDNRTYTLAGSALTIATRPAGQYVLTLASGGSGIADAAGNVLSTNATDAWRVDAGVQSRQIFYNNSKFDGFDPGANSADDLAIAADKVPLMPGQQATFANYTSYSKGINGLIVDLSGLGSAAAPTIADFEFLSSNNVTLSPSAWAPAPAPTLTFLPGVGIGGVDRVEFTWADADAIKNAWLRVKVLPSTRTGLSAADIFYFGNSAGDTGDDPASAVVDARDYYGVRDHLRSHDSPAPITWKWDLNRDGVTDATDMLLARSSANTPTTALQLFRPSSAVTAPTTPKAPQVSTPISAPTPTPTQPASVPSETTGQVVPPVLTQGSGRSVAKPVSSVKTSIFAARPIVWKTVR